MGLKIYRLLENWWSDGDPPDNLRSKPVKMVNHDKLFTWPPAVFFCALVCALLWGSAFPMVKAGIAMLNIQHSTGGKLYFAAYRFLLAGMMIFAGVSALKKPIKLSHRNDYGAMVLTGFLQTTLQYTFFYAGKGLNG